MNALSEEEKVEIQRQKEEQERIKKEMEYFDYRTIHSYKELLGKYGDVYVNDAPLATLSASNSIAEIKSKHKVMGIRMTEEVRKLAFFFLKKFPLDIHTQYYQPPEPKPYFNKKFMAVVGGNGKTVQDIMDRILMVNSLLDQADTIYLMGEIGLVGLHALGVPVGKVERSESNLQEYDKLKEFLVEILKKAVDKKVRLYLPTSFVLSPKMDFEDSVHQEEN